MQQPTSDSSILRVYVEKRPGFDVEAQHLKQDIAAFLSVRYADLARLESVRILHRYDAAHLNREQFEQACRLVFAEVQCDRYTIQTGVPAEKGEQFFAVEYLPGQYDQRSDSAEQCVELAVGVRPRVRSARVYLFKCAGGALSAETLEAIKAYIINPVDSREASLELPDSLDEVETAVPPVAAVTGFIKSDDAALAKLARDFGFAMSLEDLQFCRDYFARIGRDPTETELRVLDTYWSDHCRHSTFTTELREVEFDGGLGDGAGGETDDRAGGRAAEISALRRAWERYQETRRQVYGEGGSEKRPVTLMDVATIGAKALKRRGLLENLEESAEINACSVRVQAQFADGSSEPWLLMFKNETHNHPTEIEPFGGAATCLGGAIRDPLSGRAYVHQAMRVTGGADPRQSLQATIPGKLPQIKIAREAAAGYSSYGNQIGLATGQVAEFYHPGFAAKRMELGAVIGAVPEAWVRREEPAPGDVVLLVGGKTGRDGIGGATGSSKVHTGTSVEEAGAEVQKGNPVEERKLQRLFRNKAVSRLIKRCNDFGAGGVSVAIGELAAGLDINLDAVPKKYAGLNGTELAISESQERMAVVVAPEDAAAFIEAASRENLTAVQVATVTDSGRLRMSWRGQVIVDLERSFLDTNGASRSARAKVAAATAGNATKAAGAAESPATARTMLENLERELRSLRSGSRRGLQERFDGSIGAGSVLFPWGGREQGTPECGMAALLPSLDKECRTASLMTFGYNPDLASENPYRAAKGAVREALAKFACLGGNPWMARLSLQEYFERTTSAEAWGKPLAALLGAMEAQLELGVAAIGGKDSMSGSYIDAARGINLAVPPTLVAFAAGVAQADRIRSGALSGKAGSLLVLLAQHRSEGPQDRSEWDLFKANMNALRALSDAGLVLAAYPVQAGGIAATAALMAFGNMTGVELNGYSEQLFDPPWYQGSVLLELDESAFASCAGTTENILSGAASWAIVGRTVDEPIFRIVLDDGDPASLLADEAPDTRVAEYPLSVLRRAYEYPLLAVYPQTARGISAAEAADEAERIPVPTWDKRVKLAGAAPGNRPLAGAAPGSPALDSGALNKAAAPQGTAPSNSTAHRRAPGQLKGAKPLVVLPVFPGTNCEWDMERAFRHAGAETRQVLFRNRDRQDVLESTAELAAAIRDAQILALSGGFSAGDEPDGSGKFIANALRAPAVRQAVEDLLNSRDGLILGICNGFQALIKLGLVPYGEFREADEHMPTLTFNELGRHISRMVQTKVMSNLSPWLAAEQLGTVHTIPISHGEGRIAMEEALAAELASRGQIPFCYVDDEGFPTMAEPWNPNGSAWAIEGLTSPDGRVLGKMGHSERCGTFVHVNIPGNKEQKIFEAGVRYFL
ncbi:MAG: phosphoribosylformylglycinamidine synthase [Treponema sp.]|nr:phosphoribosylformylglycinamidine synthase [Treponema sp.]